MVTLTQEQRDLIPSALFGSYAIKLDRRILWLSPDRTGCFRRVWPPMALSVSSIRAIRPRPYFFHHLPRKSGQTRKRTTHVLARSVQKVTSSEHTASICSQGQTQ